MDAEAGPGSAEGPRRFLGAAVAALGVALYLVALPNDWVLDDRQFLFKNPLVRDLSRFGEIFRSDYWAFFTRAALYRPVTVASMALQHALADDAVWSYRAVNALLHGLAAWLLFALLRRRLGLPAAASFLGALLFAVHPAISEAVLQVVGRAEIFVALGALTLLHLHLADYALGRFGPRVLLPVALGVLLLALGSKETAVAIPPLLLAVDLARGQLRRWLGLHAAALGVLLAFWFGVRGSVVAGIVDYKPLVENPLCVLSFSERLPGVLALLGRYALLLVLPLHLRADYGFDEIPAHPGGGDPFVLAGVLVVVASLAGFLWAYRARRLPPALGIALIWLPLFPVCNLVVPIGTIFNERFLYLPAAGAAVLAAVALARLRLPWAIPVLVAATFAVRTGVRERDWRDEAMFYEVTARGSRSAKALYHHALDLHQRGLIAEAQAEYKRSLAIAPTSIKSLVDLARLHREGGRWSEAERLLKRAIALGEPDPEPYMQLALVYRSLGRVDEATSVLDRVVTLDPQTDKGWYQRGIVLADRGDYAGARAAFEQALQVVPGSLYARVGLANLARFVDRRPAAEVLASYDAMLADDPTFPDAWFGRGECLSQMGRAGEARQAYENAARLDPGNASYRSKVDALK